MQNKLKENKSKFYPEVESSPDFAKLEERVLEFWKENDTFKKSIDQRPAKIDGVARQKAVPALSSPEASDPSRRLENRSGVI